MERWSLPPSDPNAASAIERARYYTFYNIVHNLNAPWKSRLKSTKWRFSSADEWSKMDPTKVPALGQRDARPGDRRFDPAVLAAADLAIEQLRRDADTRESSRHEKRREFVRYYAALIIPYWEEEDNDEDDRGGVVCGTKSAEHYIYPSPPCQSSGWRTDAFSKL